MDENSIDDVVEGGLRQFDVTATEKYIDGCCYFKTNGVLRIIQPLQHHRVQLLQLIVPYFLPINNINLTWWPEDISQATNMKPTSNRVPNHHSYSSSNEAPYL